MIGKRPAESLMGAWRNRRYQDGGTALGWVCATGIGAAWITERRLGIS